MDLLEDILGIRQDENTNTDRVYCKGMPQWERLEKARDILNELCPKYPKKKTDYFEVKQKVWRNFGGNELHTTLVGYQKDCNDFGSSWQIDFEELNDILTCEESELEEICKEIMTIKC